MHTPFMHANLDNATISQFLIEGFSIHNLYVIFLEFAIMLPFMLVLVIVSRRGSKYASKY